MTIKLRLSTVALSLFAAIPAVYSLVAAAPALAVCQWHEEWVYWATWWFLVWTC